MATPGWVSWRDPRDARERSAPRASGPRIHDFAKARADGPAHAWNTACTGYGAMPLAQLTQLGALSAGFQLAAWHFARASGQRGLALRFLLGLGAAGPFARLGWGLLHLDRVIEAPARLLDPGSGYTLLTAPIGVAFAGLGLSADERTRYLVAGARALPLGLAAAKAGCSAAGCCGPLALAEAALLVALHGLCVGASPGRAPSVFCLGFGALRLVAEPFRPVPGVGPPAVPTALLCALWLALGLALRSRPAGPVTGERHVEARVRPESDRNGRRPARRRKLPAFSSAGTRGGSA